MDDDLPWGPNIFVTGPPAEFQIGPCARNFVGLRNAGRMLLTVSLICLAEVGPDGQWPS